jgi:hypothetical protein
MDTTESRTFAARLADLLKHERHAMADFLVALAEFDRKRGWLELGFSNLFDFLHRDLDLSKGTAFYRKLGAELIQAYPEIVEPLRDGRLCVTALHALSRAITPQNRAEVLPGSSTAPSRRPGRSPPRSLPLLSSSGGRWSRSFVRRLRPTLPFSRSRS